MNDSQREGPNLTEEIKTGLLHRWERSGAEERGRNPHDRVPAHTTFLQQHKIAKLQDHRPVCPQQR